MSSLNIPIAIGIGGFVGALMRFYIAGFVARSAGDEFSFLGTMTVNLLGCLAIGVLITIASRPGLMSPMMQKCLLTGLLGSLTTFSTFAMESLNLLQAGHFGAAVVNITVNLFAGLLLVWLGMLLAGTLIPDSSPAN
ncbi:MAG: fluoride efflux transporter CrcB [Fuerstiella sp.]